MVKELIFRQFGVRLSLVSVGRALAGLGLSPQRPLYRSYEQDPDKVRTWKQETFPQIQARAKKEDAAIFFADEASVRTNYHAGTTWAPVGADPGRRCLREDPVDFYGVRSQPARRTPLPGL
jgi:hypothetical protein